MDAVSEAPFCTDEIRTDIVRLALAELEAPTGSALAVLLALDHSRVAGKEAIGAQGGVAGGIDLGESLGEAVAAGASLTVGTAAGDGDENVVLILGGRDEQGLANDGDELAQLEVFIEFLAVYADLALAFAEEDAGSSALSAAGSDSKVPDHPLFPLLDGYDDGRLSRMRMARARVDLDVFVQLAAERPLGEHAVDGELEGSRRIAAD